MAQSLPEQLKQILSYLRLRNATIEVDEAGRRVSVTTDEDDWFTKQIPELIQEFKYIATLLARKNNEPAYVVDINNYRREREKLILEIAKASAQKVIALKQEVRLPAMNAYERRLIHTELSMRPDVKTESVGEGKDRAVVIRPI
jgi:predicted RNA-binding protein Jag